MRFGISSFSGRPAGFETRQPSSANTAYPPRFVTVWAYSPPGACALAARKSHAASLYSSLWRHFHGMAQDASLSILGSSIMGELDAALKSGSEARRIDMLARVTDVFTADATRYSEEQVRFFDDLMVRLIKSVGSGARATLAVKLAPIGNAPSGAIHALAFDHDIHVAGPVLTRSERLQEQALLASARTKSSTSSRHIAAARPWRSRNRPAHRTRRPQTKPLDSEERQRPHFGFRLSPSG